MSFFSRSTSGARGWRTPSGEQSDTAQRLELLDSFETAGLGWFWATDDEGRITYLSPNANAKFKWDAQFTIGKSLTDLFVIEEAEDKSERPLNFLLNARNTISQLAVRISDPSREIWWEIAGKPQRDKNGNFIGYRGSAKDITESREKQRSAERLAQFDSLTGLANRHRIDNLLTNTLNAYRNSKRSCALMMVDLDRFKQVNDTLGHPAGDELLKQVADRLTRIVDTQGTVGRPGGDEFQIILPDIDDRGALGELGQRLIQFISQPYSLQGSRAIIGTSLGIAIAPYDGLDATELVKAADLALYAAKGGGRGTYRFYS
ncbi:diguanylate cyclase domain-containing protein, partial [Qipengyuania sp. MTN3-11]|uniref:diguanylate cyclase domain-containing protein n=1 Tax=Qipengyuania sp. MTN3-11 TaxID=3056557 RepID=UPI0036F25604